MACLKLELLGVKASAVIDRRYSERTSDIAHRTSDITGGRVDAWVAF